MCVGVQFMTLWYSIIVTVVENESKGTSSLVWAVRRVCLDHLFLLALYLVDPQIPNPADRATKLRSQQEVHAPKPPWRAALSPMSLQRKAMSLLQRTRLNVSIQCQAWHTKNS